MTEVIVEEEGGDRSYLIPFGARLNVEVGQEVQAGGQITKGPLDPHDIMRLTGVQGVYEYLIREVQRVYKNQGVDINDKHIEIIVSQMLSKYKVEKSGDTALLPGGQYSRRDIEEANAAVEVEGGETATASRQLLGITKAALATSSFLSAASFQETTRVLTDASIKGKTDRLEGLKENVMIGKLIPAGTGMKRYSGIEVDYGEYEEYVNGKAEYDEEEGEEGSIENIVAPENVDIPDEEIKVYGEVAIVE